ncbi:MAG: tripartite tricarboxylate transporter substrate binding protein [Betaproteobacteria bacterium]|nr:MAG: tripartite tricarboxylate transporter substrate binding protein [Betaproteobacteria bacterium]
MAVCSCVFRRKCANLPRQDRASRLGRHARQRVRASLGVPVIVENRLGAGGVVAAKYVASAEPDGHLVMIYTSAFTVAPLLNPGTIDPKELTAVATLGTVPTVLIVNPSKGYKSVADLVAAAKAKPGRLVASNAGIGSSTHMNLERFRLAAGIEFLSVPTKGNAEAITEVITGRADAYFSPVFSVIAHVKEGRVQALAVGSPKRTPLFPDLPTTVEAGYPNSDYNFWIGALVASKTPRETVQRLHREFNAALAQPDVQDRMKKLGVDPLTLSVAEFEAMINKELEDNARLLKAAGITPG